MSRCHPDFIQACVGAAGDVIRAPRIYQKWSAISAIAGALGRKCWYDAGAFELRPNLFIMLVDAPGTGKSLSFSLPYEKVYKKLAVLTGTRKDSDNWNPNIDIFGLDYPLYWTGDRVTPEELGVELTRTYHTNLALSTPSNGVFHSSSISIITSELGTFLNRNDNYLQRFLTDMWDSRPDYNYRTKTAGVFFIKGPCVNWLSCATPTDFVNCMPESAKDQGLLSRIIPIYADAPRLVDDIEYSKASDVDVYNLQCDFAEISKMRGRFSFDPAFKEEARADVRAGLLPVPTSFMLDEYRARRVSHLLKIAMAISASQDSNMLITAQVWARAKELLFEAEGGMPHVLTFFGLGKTGQLTSDLLRFIDSVGKPFPLTLLRREIIKRVSTSAEVETTLKVMNDSGMISIQGTQVKRGG